MAENEYRPWAERGCTELEYYKALHLVHVEEIAKFKAELGDVRQRANDIRRDRDGVLKERDAAYREGWKEGVALFAWWKDGIQYVGTCGTTLEAALKEKRPPQRGHYPYSREEAMERQRKEEDEREEEEPCPK